MLNGALVHLALNHIPVLLPPFIALLLLTGLMSKSQDKILAGFYGLMLVALITIPVLRSGGPAAHLIIHEPGVTREDIHEHAEAGEGGFWAIEILGVASLIGAFLLKGSNRIPKGWTILVLLGALGISGWMAWVAHLGGLIRHPELKPDFQATVAASAPPPGSPTAAPPAVPAKS